MDEASPAEAGAAPQKKRPLLRRVPTSLVVTLVGIALTAWLLPAFTRQWDDRQKAQQLKAAIVADMASASARALIGGEAFWSGRQVDETQVLDAWTVASLQLETRLRTYVGAPYVTAWQIYSWLVTRFNNAHRGQAVESMITATQAPIHLDPGASKAIAGVVMISDNAVPNGPHFEASRLSLFEELAVHNLRSYLRPYLNKQALPVPPQGFVLPPGMTYGPNTAEAALLAVQAELAREILGAHVAGYSTNAHDFFRNLIP